ncbi:MAG: hypothetical protein HWN67_19010 [Candidatus Helarchaeota archaeon]|nr:hypothetical protein [Candidatus Helarchaeota archaeon]
MISGVKRRETAAEGAKLFITPETLCQRLRRETDRKKIIEITGKKNKFLDFLFGSVTIQLFHYVGLRIDKITSQTQLSTETEREFELNQKKTLFSELKEISSDFFLKEIEIFEKEVLIEQEIIKNAIDQRKQKLDKEVIFNKNLKFLRSQLISIFRNYPNQFFYDYIGKILGLSDTTRKEILQNAAEFKPTQIEIEKEMKREYEDEFIELAVFNRIKKIINEKWEIIVPKQLEMQSVILRRLESDIIKFLSDKIPFSEKALSSYLESGELKLKIIELIKGSCLNDRFYEEIESSMLNLLNGELHKQALRGSNSFLNFMSNLLEISLDEVMRFLDLHEIKNVTNFCQALSLEIGEIEEKLESKLISDSDLFRLGTRGSLVQAQKTLETLKVEERIPETLYDLTLEDLYAGKTPIFDKLLDEICKRVKISPESLKSLIEKNKMLKQIIKDTDIRDIEQIRLSLKMDNILKEISRDIFYTLITNFLRSISRVVEQYQKIKKDKEIFLIALNRIFDLKSSENWIKVKVEDLIIKKIMDRQKEILDLVENKDPFFINGFIWARLSDKTIKKALEELKQTNSPVYEYVKPLPLSFDNIPPISYATAYDMCIRIENSLQKKRLESEKRKAKETVMKTVKTKQAFKDADTYGWLEKRINMSIMRIGKIQPSQLYWKDQDSDKLSKIILLHTQVKRGQAICPECGEKVDLEKCDIHGPCTPKSASIIDTLAKFYSFSMDKLKKIDFKSAKNFVLQTASPILKTRLGHEPTTEEYEKLLEGEILELGKLLGDDIGKKLNKVLYKTWRKKELGR